MSVLSVSEPLQMTMLVDKQHEQPTHSSLQQPAPVSQPPTARLITQSKVSSRTSSLLSRIQSNKVRL
ncbi:unnamed protein product [Rotaria magnacalcarata]|uniref:Uncharacterized protein n=1 Tax=Rotaria magnacalcarata TaxID=392030 RepID=A0A820PYB9_9BILA|nr:unnamed protein product [Rotaria magnacalcarata]CAF4082107.1 unnamed protein product [Rotaria magnacalcarata]CAF4108281.1 unnamed protein product [Rotaria magnacalcarata]CAF4156016.1 unnamed protein product [Rotaria magnacalcarata]CAF4414487.1 unnamed protein product [Rotaria magnacalcarata]